MLSLVSGRRLHYTCATVVVLVWTIALPGWRQMGTFLWYIVMLSHFIILFVTLKTKTHTIRSRKTPLDWCRWNLQGQDGQGRRRVQLCELIKWRNFHDGFPNLFIEEVGTMAGKDGNDLFQFLQLQFDCTEVSNAAYLFGWLALVHLCVCVCVCNMVIHLLFDRR